MSIPRQRLLITRARPTALTYGEAPASASVPRVASSEGIELTHAYVGSRRRHAHAAPSCMPSMPLRVTCSRCVHGARYVFGGEDVDELMEARRSAPRALAAPCAACGRLMQLLEVEVMVARRRLAPGGDGCQ